MTRTVVASIEVQYRSYRDLGSAAMAQLTDEQLAAPGPGGGNSIVVLVRHIAGNLRSRFTDFLDTDGEKPWRNREGEFDTSALDRDDLDALWLGGWEVLLGALAEIDDSQLTRIVKIRGVDLMVVEALHRSLGHIAMHVGQIVYLAKALKGGEWRYLTIAPGKTAEYNQNPVYEKGYRRL
jgi:hypothetical protein